MAEVRIELITSTTDVPACARLCVTAVSSDPFHTFLDRYGSESFYDSTVTRLMDAINPDNTTDFAFKAVCDITDDNGGIREEIVGVSHWYIGYIKIPKMDPFANKVVGEPNEIGPEEVAIGDETGTLDTGNQSSQVIDTVKKAKVMDEFHRTHGNIYISKIRGKKHVCKSLP
ncbi:uncharacterized protein HMPREF1541_05947 [Cyphellophora europaea CBS 101466]|uniref:Uncharacterized protein n=1 Tax=Cyphellophora europaea (strain CBS 101466) TaxID=1220924 RepID=W2RT77_CYPE1|nr:uncharacterized protein HMPREF1541_05947 [Cyphellophora europaea CBS 101466]ETN39721.1 hypothetical protein HMPREF1541_05947 [Cyphellophora europaea CBS 101466]